MTKEGEPKHIGRRGKSKPVEKQSMSSDPLVLGDAPGVDVPVDMLVDWESGLDDSNSRRRFHRKYRRLFENAKDTERDILAVPFESTSSGSLESGGNKVKILIGFGLAATVTAGAIVGARVLHKYRQAKQK